MVNVGQQSALVEVLGARRHVYGRVLREEVDGLEADFEHLARHDGEIFDARDLSVREDSGLAKFAKIGTALMTSKGMAMCFFCPS